MAEAKPAVLSVAATPSLFVETVERVRPDIRLIGLLALGHLVIDVNQGALSAVLPFVKAAHGLSYAQVGMLFLLVDEPWLRLLMLALFGGLLTSTLSVVVQSYLPRNAGMASGLMVGLAMGTGGVAVIVLGWLADRWGVPAALWVS